MNKIILFCSLFLCAVTVVSAQTKAGKLDTITHVRYYTCSMHPEVMSDKAGKCPKCGMDMKLSAKEQFKESITKNYKCPVHVDVTSHDPGKCPKCGKAMQLSVKEQMKADVTKLYTCPMHPDVALDKEGKCPKCGKALVEKKNN
ncbi:MAG: heavy metal-binding domain-containing protein [Agriterribacter sp.]